MGTLHRIVSYSLVLLLVALQAPADDANAPTADASVPAADVSTPAPASGPAQIGFLFVNYYDADMVELERRSAWISEYDVAVALHLVQRSDVELDAIIAWRREGSSWDAITRRCGLGCEIYYVELQPDTALSEPYIRPYATWDERPGVDLRLTDVEVRELVLLRAMSEYCQASADEIVTLRSAGQSPRAIVADNPPRRRAGAASSASENSAPPIDATSPTGARH